MNTAMTACARDKSGDAGQQNCAVRDRCASHICDEVEDETVVDAEHCRSQRIADRAPVPTPSVAIAGLARTECIAAAAPMIRPINAPLAGVKVSI